MVYGNLVGEFYTEESNTEPVEIYGTMKLAGEVVTRGLANFMTYHSQLFDHLQFMAQQTWTDELYKFY